ncbi:MAG: SpoIVB peptidase [Ruminococcaceae bacterium]|nr:SpoIVB peptidase [Oscillospiraceae bacterium]
MKKSIRSTFAPWLLCLCLVFSLIPSVSAKEHPGNQQSPGDFSRTELIPGGIPFGVKFTTDGVLIVGFCDIEINGDSHNPARQAGLKIKDVLTHVGDQPITSAEDLTAKITASGGNALTIRYTRGGKEATTTLTPLPDGQGGFKTGLYVRDSGAGIGTVTFFVPGNGAFAGLGHGICDVDTGELMPLHRGNVSEVTISGVNRGVAGTPGELRGYFGTGKCGTLLGNTACGVYGLYRSLPEGLPRDAYPIATRQDLKEGPAQVLCTLSSNERKSYDIRISAIDRDARGSKCFTVQITDPTLLEETGGIVQGMSGSPILQDGKLVGAVTHVLINNPAVGYGIFVENMLAQMGDLAS